MLSQTFDHHSFLVSCQHRDGDRELGVPRGLPCPPQGPWNLVPPGGSPAPSWGLPWGSPRGSLGVLQGLPLRPPGGSLGPPRDPLGSPGGSLGCVGAWLGGLVVRALNEIMTNSMPCQSCRGLQRDSARDFPLSGGAGQISADYLFIETKP